MNIRKSNNREKNFNLINRFVEMTFNLELALRVCLDCHLMLYLSAFLNWINSWNLSSRLPRVFVSCICICIIHGWMVLYLLTKVTKLVRKSRAVCVRVHVNELFAVWSYQYFNL